MSDTPQTPEAVALALLQQIAASENWNKSAGSWKKTQAEILDAFAECLSAARGLRTRPKP